MGADQKTPQAPTSIRYYAVYGFILKLSRLLLRAGQNMQIVDDRATAETRRDSCVSRDSEHVGLATNQHA